MAEVRIDGRWLSVTVGKAGDLKWSHQWSANGGGGGSHEASWQMDLPATFVQRDLHIDALVEIVEGCAVVWSGHLQEPQFNGETWDFVAIGKYRLAENFPCLITGGTTSTSRPDLAVQQAILRGLRWTSNIPTQAAVVSTGATDSLNYLPELLNAWTNDPPAGIGHHWGVDTTGAFFTYDDSTTPTYHLMPGSHVLGIADEDTASHLFGRYMPTSTTFATVQVDDPVARAKRGYREQAIDLTQYGVLTSTQATNKLNALLAKGATKPAWANGLEIARAELTTVGGVPVYLPFVGTVPGVIRMHGVIDPVNDNLTYLDFVIGEVQYEDGSDVIQVNPLGLVKGKTFIKALTNVAGRPVLRS